MSGLVRAAALPVAFALAAVALVVAGRGGLAAPPLAPEAFASWASERGAATALIALVRLGALVVCGWWAVLSTTVALGRAAGAVRLVVVAERGLPAPLRRAAGAGLASVAVLGGPAAAEAPTDEVVAGESLVLLPAEGAGTATMSVLPEEPPASPPPAAPTPSPVPEWVVAPGDSFWSIAEELVADEGEGAPAERQVLAYWRTLVEANRDRLVSGDPDLLLPGQSLVLPPVTGVRQAT